MSEKLNSISKKISKSENLVFKIERKGEILYQQEMDLHDFSKEVLDRNEVSLYYSLKDFVNEMESNLGKKHAKMILDGKASLEKGKVAEVNE